MGSGFLYFVRSMVIIWVVFHIINTEVIGQQSIPIFGSENGNKYLLPEENKIVFNRNIELRWQGNPMSKRYHLQVATDKHFEQKVLDTIVDKQFCTIKKLARHKNYFWRVLGNTHVPESKNIYADYSFFKTTSIQLNDSRNINDISLIPSWVNNQELIYVDNPENLEYDITVISMEENCKKYTRTTNTEKQGIVTHNWPRGRYIVELKIGEAENQITEIMLTQN